MRFQRADDAAFPSRRLLAFGARKPFDMAVTGPTVIDGALPGQ